MLFGEGDTCKHCGAALAATPVRVGATSPSAAPPAAAAPSALGPTPPALPRVSGPFTPPVPPAPAASAHVPREFWTPETTTAPSGPRPRSQTGIVVALVTLFVLASLIGYGLYRRATALPPGTSAFVAGHGQTFDSPDGTFSVQFPSNPEVDDTPVQAAGLTIPTIIATSEGAGYQIMVSSAVFPVNIPRDEVNERLDTMLSSGMAKAPAQLVAKHTTLRGGLPGIDATYKAEDGSTAHALVLVWSNKVYFLLVHAHLGTERLFHALDTSFVVH